jgi:hypothetical protein
MILQFTKSNTHTPSISLVHQSKKNHVGGIVGPYDFFEVTAEVEDEVEEGDTEVEVPGNVGPMILVFFEETSLASGVEGEPSFPFKVGVGIEGPNTRVDGGIEGPTTLVGGIVGPTVLGVLVEVFISLTFVSLVVVVEDPFSILRFLVTTGVEEDTLCSNFTNCDRKFCLGLAIGRAARTLV